MTRRVNGSKPNTKKTKFKLKKRSPTLSSKNLKEIRLRKATNTMTLQIIIEEMVAVGVITTTGEAVITVVVKAAKTGKTRMRQSSTSRVRREASVTTIRSKRAALKRNTRRNKANAMLMKMSRSKSFKSISTRTLRSASLKMKKKSRRAKKRTRSHKAQLSHNSLRLRSSCRRLRQVWIILSITCWRM